MPPATIVVVVDPGDGGKAVRHLDPNCPELPPAAPGTVLGSLSATKNVRMLTVRCPRCFAEVERREAEERSRRRPPWNPDAQVERRREGAAQASGGSAMVGQSLSETAPISAEAAAHFVRVARCPNLKACLDDQSPGHSCSTIVLNQWLGIAREERLARWRDAHQLPEPWEGHLETAPILFVSSNPSISGSVNSQRPAELEHDPPTSYLGYSAEQHPSIRKLGQGPKWSWADDEIVDRYEAAFDLYIADGVAGRLPDGSTARATRYWIEVRARAQELIAGRRVRPGIDYALTEAVRCKSREERGVEEALETCSKLYLRETVERSAARVVVVLGRLAARAVEAQFDVAAARRAHERVLIGGKPRSIVFLPHPNARMKRSFAAVIGTEALDRLRAAMASD